VQEQSLQADAALAQHGRRALCHFLRRLRRYDQMQFLLLRIVPGIGAVGLQRCGIAGLRGVVARQDQPIGGRVRKLVVDAIGVIHALRANVAIAPGLRPDRFMVVVGRRYRPLFHRGKNVLVVRSLAANAHEPR
jgi:hypothetical protein